MKNLFQTIILLFTLTVISCKKTHDINNSQNLVLLQHKWSLVVRHGEALRYVGQPDDYYNFSTDNILYRHVNNTYDTGYYTLLADRNNFLFYPVVNGITSDTAANYSINSISETQLVISSSTGPTQSFTDSLKR
jgi:hypothetical protein